MASINYNDKRFTTVNNEKNTAINESNKLYDGMINQSDGFYQAQIDAANQWGATQEKLQQDRTDFTIQKIEQEKEQSYKDYQKEGSAAYVDWQKQKDDYGSNAEKMASSGLASSGYSESSQVAMYNQYQNRVMAAREVYNKALLNYNNSITEARLQNSSALAEIAYNTLQKQLELGLAGFQAKNTLLLQKTQAKRDLDNTYYGRYQDVVSQLNTEKSMAEQVRQYNQSYALDLKKYNESVRQFNANLAEEKRQFNETLALQKKKSNVSSSGGGGGDVITEKPKKGDDKPKVDKTDEKLALKEKQTQAKAIKNALTKAKSVKTKKDALNLLKSVGITKSVSIIDSVAWNKAKRLGDGGSDIQNFKNYAAYLQWYCTAAINGEF